MTYEEYQSMVKDEVVEAEWKYLDVNNDGNSIGHMWMVISNGIMKHGGGMRKLLKQ